MYDKLKPHILYLLSYFLASQYWCLLRILPFLIGKSVPEDDDVWRFYLLIMEIVDICCCPRFPPKLLIVLEMSLFSMINEFKRVHHPHKIIPKMHYLLLYPMLMKKVGPLTQFSCMRFESKHRAMKRIVTTRNNYKNVAHTIAINNQVNLLQARKIYLYLTCKLKRAASARQQLFLKAFYNVRRLLKQLQK